MTKQREYKKGEEIFIKVKVVTHCSGAFDADWCVIVDYGGSWVKCKKCGKEYVNDNIAVDLSQIKDDPNFK